MIVKVAVHKYFPDATDIQVEAIIMGCTAFPFVAEAQVLKSLKSLGRYSGGDINKALQMCDDELDIAMAKACDNVNFGCHRHSRPVELEDNKGVV